MIDRVHALYQGLADSTDEVLVIKIANTIAKWENSKARRLHDDNNLAAMGSLLHLVAQHLTNFMEEDAGTIAAGTLAQYLVTQIDVLYADEKRAEIEQLKIGKVQ